MTAFVKPDNHAELLTSMPHDLPILPLHNTVAFPFSVLPLMVGIPRAVKLIEDAFRGNRLVALVAAKDSSIEEPQPGQVYEIGTIAKIYYVAKQPDNTLQVFAQGLERFRIEHWLGTEPYLRARIAVMPDVVEPGVELDALHRGLRDLAKEIIALSPNVPDEVGNFLNQVQDPRYLAYLVAANVGLEVAKGQQILETDNIKEKLTDLISHLAHEKEVLTLDQKIQTEAHEEMGKAQREYYLHQQLKAIQKELGEADESRSALTTYRKKIKRANLPEEPKQEAQRELRRLEGMSQQAPEYSVIQTYLDWLLDLPWNELSEDQLDINSARVVLDEDHYDLQEVKDRIMEYLAVRKLVAEREGQIKTGREAAADEAMGTILCFVGPPGVGKTSLGQSIARALGRTFTRMSLGAMRDEAEIHGHRRTYVGAMPGRIIQAIRRAGTRNPVFMLDEVDKIGVDWRGDPSSALLEVLDPAQNRTFRDYYLDVDFDLSEVIFITTANQVETVPPSLRDRMEIIELDGYTEYEKIHIARRYLVPRQVKANGLREKEISFTEDALRKIVQDYTREAGVRSLERNIGTICRKSAVKIASQELTHVEITGERVREYLKKERFESESSESLQIPGIATALSVTPVGGDILFVEATRMEGKGELIITGQLGEVMRESAQLAYSYVRSKASRLDLQSKLFEKTDVHLHVPAGAVSKDGPSAGVAILMAIASLLSGRPVRSDLGMTGEVTLRGRILPVGGIKMKVLAAHRAGLATVLLPKRNERDLDEVPEDVRNAMKFVPIEWIDEALNIALLPRKPGTQIPAGIASNRLPQTREVSLH